MEILKLRNVLTEAERFSWKLSLFLPKDEEWTLDSSCFLFDLDDLDDNVDEPDFAVENGFRYSLCMHDIQGIVDNAISQRANCSGADLLDAFLFYFDNDAFIEL